MTDRPFRVLVTGSRRWVWVSEINAVLDDLRAQHGPALIVVHGDCSHGADAIADTWCRTRGVPVERHPAQWSLGRHAGFLRNADMVVSHPDLCVAFIRDDSSGAVHCSDLARKAGIPTVTYLR